MVEDGSIDSLFSDALEEVRKNQRYVLDHYDSLQEDYGDTHVFVLDEGVIDTMQPIQDDESTDEYMRRVEQRFDELREEYGERFDEIYEEYIPDPGTSYIYTL